ncbi:putative membrane protein [Gottschalkia purinilytica]|uniref:Putative membrane protein n=1 Tax=Gottschalkia purinilytica TaxID=1503 RepID=A0A0L0W6L4_GOTPU|nr:hypothetical protein [Gottschalkia purinilytica]KNF07127.1 putative membrane protein [Gottschalkia purinilytica]
MKRDLSWIELASVYIGTVIGAGFATGQEVLQFFGVHGYKGIMGVIISTILFSILGALILLKVFKDKHLSYQEIIRPVFGNRIGLFVELIMCSYLFIGFCIMLAGSGVIVKEQLGVSIDVGIYIMAVCTLVTILFSVKGISIVNTILVPILLLGIFIVGGSVVLKEGLNLNNFMNPPIKENWLKSSILYVSYNTISSIVVLGSMLSIIKTKKSAIKGGIFGGIGLGVMATFILLPILILYKDIYRLEVPMLRISQYLGSKGVAIYSIILWCAMFTTAIANGFGCISRICDLFRLNEKITSIVFCIVTIPLAKAGFSNLVSTFYPLFGYIATVILALFILISIFKKLKKSFKYIIDIHD